MTGNNRRVVKPRTSGGRSWQSRARNFNERMQYLYTTGELSDLDIFFQEDEDPVKVHILILSTNSPVFLEMLKERPADGKITLPDDSRQVFQKLVDYMYLDRLGLKSVEEAVEVYALAYKYQMKPAMKECVQYIVSSMKKETMLAVLEMSANEGAGKKCKENLDHDPSAVKLSETVSQISKESLNCLLTDDTLASSSRPPSKD